MRIQPLVLTRPICKPLDYQWFACPMLLMHTKRQLDDKDGLIRHKVDSVLNTDINSGALPKDGRWHIWHIEGVIIVAHVTERFGHKDGFGRDIRGYYGFVTKDNLVGVPSDRCVDLLEEKFVAPFINTPVKLDPVWSDYLQIDDSLFTPLNGVENVGFNYDNAHVKYFASPKWAKTSLLSAAIDSANKSNPIEFVYGVNFRYHAESSAFMNAVCYEQKVDAIVSVEGKRTTEEEPTFSRVKRESNEKESRKTTSYTFKRGDKLDASVGRRRKGKYRLVLECSCDWQKRLMKGCAKFARRIGLLDDCKEVNESECNGCLFDSGVVSGVESPSVKPRVNRIRRDDDMNIGF